MPAKASEHPEVLTEIFQQVLRPAPKCSSEAMEVDISQGDLAACMRVSAVRPSFTCCKSWTWCWAAWAARLTYLSS